MRIFISGPMVGVPRFNFPASTTAFSVLCDWGHDVFEPVERDLDRGILPEGVSFEELADGTHRFSARESLGEDVAWIAAHAEAICLLPGWEDDARSVAELSVAAALGLQAGYLDDFRAVNQLMTAQVLLNTRELIRAVADTPVSRVTSALQARNESDAWAEADASAYTAQVADDEARLALAVADVMGPSGSQWTGGPGVECVQIARHWNFNCGNALTYLWHAASVHDLEKAIACLVDEIDRISEPDAPA
jgi:hypothetical protein